jgi:hypothetical protein
MLIYRKDQNKFQVSTFLSQPSACQVNFSAFHSTYEVDTPLCSAQELDRIQDRHEGRIQVGGPMKSKIRWMSPAVDGAARAGHRINGERQHPPGLHVGTVFGR